MEPTQEEIQAREQYSKMKEEKQARYQEYCETYSEQLRLQGYISSLKNDNEHIAESAKTATKFRDKRRAKKLTKINDKDINKYERMLDKLPPVPEFK